MNFNPSDDRHRKEWESSCIPDAIINRNFWSIYDSRRVDELLNRNTDKDKKWQHSDHLVPGWAVAGVDPKTGERTLLGAQYKPDTPLTTKDPKTGKEKTNKYLSAANQTIAPLFLEQEDHDYWPKLIAEVHQPILITEGAKKAGSVFGQDYPCISLPGVTTGAKLGRLRKELKYFCSFGRKVFIAFDRDVMTKPNVIKAVFNLSRQLAAEGCVVWVLEWDNRHKGIDDHIAQGGTLSEAIDEAKTIEEWKENTFNKDGSLTGEPCKLLQDYRRVARALSDRIEWNVLTRKVMVDGEVVEADELRVFLAKSFNLQIAKQDCGSICLDLARSHEVDPIKDYLDYCANSYETEPDLLDLIAPIYLKADHPLHIKMVRKTLIAAAARIYEPGCKVDTVLILQGYQGHKKSTFFETLASKDWFEDGMNEANDKDEILKMHDAWFCEWAELETVFKRKDVSQVKQFVTCARDRIRVPYGSANIVMPRRSILVGTTNEQTFLADPTGSRRFWVVPVGLPTDTKIDIQSLGEQRDRIWAAAVHAYRAKEQWWLTPTEEAEAQKMNEPYQEGDTWEEAIGAWIHCRSRFTLDELLRDCFGIALAEQDLKSQRRAGKALRKLGWESKPFRNEAGILKRIWTEATDDQN